MRYLIKHILFLTTAVILSGCAHHNSGSYVLKNGKWVFVHNNIGLRSVIGSSDMVSDTTFDPGRFMWPVPSSKRISSTFGTRGSKHHDGIDIPARSGSHIVASDDGKVIFSGKMRGYGNIVVVKHSGGYHTVYAHNRKNLVNKGQSVSRGEVVGQVGNSGRSTGPHVHFEIRKNNKSRNPASYLPLSSKMARK